MKRDASPAIASLDSAKLTGLLISIGCNRYDHIGDLNSAESDAFGVHSALTTGLSAHYDPINSQLLISPTRAQIEECLRTALQKHKHTPTVTFYFAGHGEFTDGTLNLCSSDTSPDAWSVTAINIAQVLRFVCEMRPQHAYIILDACFSGGVAVDLPSILRTDILELSLIHI